MEVIKRNGDIAKFEKRKIENAIIRAMKNGSGIYVPEIAKLVAKDSEEHFKGDMPTIYQIEEYVYKRLIHYGQTLTARAYEGYRAVQSFKREANTTDESIMGLINRSNEDVLNENSNKNGILASTQRDLIAGEISKDIARRKLIPAHIVQAHDEGVIHWHDMDYTMQPIHNCCLINLDDMLQNGTVINDKLVEKPKSFSTACTVVTQVIAAVASSQFGGCSVTIKHIAPFLRVSEDKFRKQSKERYTKNFPQLTPDLINELVEKEVQDRLKEELKAGIQTIRYQLSTLNTSNGQLAVLFSNR